MRPGHAKEYNSLNMRRQRFFSRLFLRDSLFVGLLVAVALVKGTLYSLVTPPWQAPDEPKHFEYVRLLNEKGRLVYPNDASPSVQRELIQSMAQFDYWTLAGRPQPPELPGTFQEVWGESSSALGGPPLPYLFSFPVFRLVWNSDVVTQLYALRLLTVFLGVMVILLAFLLGRALFPEDVTVRMALPLFILFMPMYSFVAGSYTNQLMADLAVAAALYVMVLALKKGVSLYTGLALTGTMVMAYLSKRTSLFVIPLSLAYLPLTASRGRRLFRTMGLTVLVLAGLAILMVLTASLPAGLRGLRWLLLDRYFWDGFEGFLRELRSHDYFSGAYLYLLMKYFQTLFESYWGVFGWMSIRLDPAWYWGLLVIALASVAGLGSTMISRSGRGSLTKTQKDALVLCLAAIVLAVSPVIALYSSQFAPAALPQGRYLFPVVIPVSLIIILGLRRLVPTSLAKVYPFALVAGMFLFDTASLMLYIVPYYYGHA